MTCIPRKRGYYIVLKLTYGYMDVQLTTSGARQIPGIPIPNGQDNLRNLILLDQINFIL